MTSRAGSGKEIQHDAGLVRFSRGEFDYPLDQPRGFRIAEHSLAQQLLQFVVRLVVVAHLLVRPYCHRADSWFGVGEKGFP